jgi:cytochrome P450/deferrochelatase/peroxidase EfeB
VAVANPSDVQANVLRGLHMAHAMHLGLKFSQADGARAFLAGLLNGQDGLPQISHGADWAPDFTPAYALTLGLTIRGLRDLGLSPADDAAFKLSFPAFVAGPEDPCAAPLNGDICLSEPVYWRLGGPNNPVRLVLSLYADDPDELARQTAALRQGMAVHGLREVVAWPAETLAGPDSADRRYVHFGYQDGLSQPRLAILGAPAGEPDMQLASRVGEFLLGAGYPNVYGGADSLGGLSPGLAQNASFCALRIMAQDVAGFERLLDEASIRYGVSREWLAAKLMGRWRDGTPLSQSSDSPLPEAGAPLRNSFDYAPSHANPVTADDAIGLRCPVGAHVRRMNPRSATVAGKPYSRRLLRRGMPYGPAYVPGADDPAVERGLVGLFICADLDRQFQFILRQWAQGDQATSGVRAEQDPIIGAQQALLGDDHPMSQHFRIPRGGGRDDIVLEMPRLVNTVGSAYLFMPGLAALATLSQPRAAQQAALAAVLNAAQWMALAPASVGVGVGVGAAAAALAALPDFDPTDPDFRRDPFSVYAAYRSQAPVKRFTLSGVKTVWVFDHAMVDKVASNSTRYHKQVPDQPKPAGLLNMDDPWHAACREELEPLFSLALAKVLPLVAPTVAAQFAACRAKPQPVDWVANFAEPVARTLFFSLFGVAHQDAGDLMKAVGLALTKASPIDETPIHDAIQAVASRVVLLAGKAPAGSLLKLILGMGGPHDPANSRDVEHLANATVMVLAGVLPAQWAITLATWHLLDNGGEQLQVLRTNPGITDRDAAEELLRFDTATPMSLRYATEDHRLGDVAIQRKDRVMLAWASASRDSAGFGANADSIDFSRRRGPGWAFGKGNGFECLGKVLVLSILDELIRTLRNANPEPTLPAGFQPLWTGAMMFREIKAMPVRCV